MKIIRKLVPLAIIALAACNPLEPMQGVENAPVPAATQQRYSDDQIGKIIVAAALNRGWQVDQQQPGMIHLTLHWINYSAKAGVDTAKSCVDGKCAPESHDSGATITYTLRNYTISPDPASDGAVPAGLTYRTFNRNIDRLKHDIDKNLAQAAHR